MGRTTNIAKAMEELSAQFKPRELTDDNVQAIFNRCLAKADTPKENIWLSILFQRLSGSNENSAPISFDKVLLNKSRLSIMYLYGQLKYIHENKSVISPEIAVKKYDGKIWAKSASSVMSLFHVGRASGIITSFNATSKKASTIKLLPTLSPKDPNFPAWWEAHKGEWEE